MPAFLLTWNPDKWSWPELSRNLEEFRATGVLVGRWSCGRSKSLASGDRVFFHKQGVRGRGIFASGYVQGGVFDDVHFADASKRSRYVTVAYDALLDPSTGLLPREALNAEPLNRVNWQTLGGGIRIVPDAANALEILWESHVRSQGLAPQRDGFPDDDELLFPEGASREITVKAFERSAAAAALCRAMKGTVCRVCGMDFAKTYGRIGIGFIHIHHTQPLAGGQQRRTAVSQLEPVCPNCHSMLHKRCPPFTIDELKEIVKQQRAMWPQPDRVL